jgi:hypothetical protein
MANHHFCLKMKDNALLLESHERLKAHIGGVLSSLEADLITEGFRGDQARLNKVARLLTVNEIEKYMRKSMPKVGGC